MQQLRSMKIETKKKDKLITKKNFMIGRLEEKVQLIERSNKCLFKELDQSLINVGG